MPHYIYQWPNWPNFYWEQDKLAEQLAHIHQRQGQLLGMMQVLGFTLQNETTLNNLTLEVIKSSEIEGEMLNASQVRSSIARRLGIPLDNYAKASRNVEGVVDMILDATQNYNEPLTSERLCDWHIGLLSADLKSIYLKIGAWRDDANGPMQVVSGAISRERIHFEAPPAACLEQEINFFIAWLNNTSNIDLVVKAAIAHLWFITLHPFEDGNGRIARAITDWLLAKSEKSAQRFYSMSAQIKQERKAYYAILESTQKGTLDITRYLEWFFKTLEAAFDDTERSIKLVLLKARFWEQHANTVLNDRQRLILNKLMDGFKGKLNTTKWSQLAKCSQDTALRDIQHLIHLDILIKDPAGGRSTSYSLKI